LEWLSQEPGLTYNLLSLRKTHSRLIDFFFLKKLMLVLLFYKINLFKKVSCVLNSHGPCYSESKYDFVRQLKYDFHNYVLFPMVSSPLMSSACTKKKVGFSFNDFFSSFFLILFSVPKPFPIHFQSSLSFYFSFRFGPFSFYYYFLF
jgi:hypothetical protein